MHIEDISYAAKARKLVRAHHGATRKATHFQPLMVALFDLFGVPLLSVAQFDSAVRDTREYGSYAGFIDLLCPGELLVHAGDAGADLDALLKEAEHQVSALPRHGCPGYLLITDLQRFRLYSASSFGWHLKTEFYLAELAENIGALSFIASMPLTAPQNLPEATEDAAKLLAKFRINLLATEYPEADVDTYVIKLLMILCMDQNGLFERGIFYRLILGCTREDGSDVGERIAAVFQTLDTPATDRQASMTEEIKAFPYINGSVFKGRMPIAYFSTELRLQLLELIAYNWRDISLELIGALYEESAVTTRREHRRRGWYFTPAVFTLQVLQPLFLSELQQTFEQIRLRRASEQPAPLNALCGRLANITVLDPACGSGYFLTGSYLALRTLETAIIAQLLRLGSKPEVYSRLTVDQMVGIEIDPTAAQIAWASLLLADQRANNDLSRSTGRYFARIPLPAGQPSVHCWDALAIDWATVLPPERCSYIVGNPPYGGAKLLRQGAASPQFKQLRKIEQTFDVNLSRLDFAAAWLIKAADMVQRSEGRTRIGFVTTSSLTQGEQVAELWPILFDRYRLEILFAQRPSGWGRSAAVSAVVLGLAARDGPGVADTPRLLFERVTTLVRDPMRVARERTELVETQVPYISAYLRAAATPARAQLVIPSRSKPICRDVPVPRIGTKPIDGGHLIVKGTWRRDALLAKDPDAAALLRPYVGAREMLYDTTPTRWLLVTSGVSRVRQQKMDAVRKRLRAAQAVRSHSPNAGTRNLAPGEFHVTTIPDRAFIGIPEVIDPSRTYLPIGWLEPPTIPSNLLKVLPAEPWLFGVLSSRAHMAWLRAIGGVLDDAPRYSIRVVYNNFPWPEADTAQRALVGEFTEAVLAARAAEHAKATEQEEPYCSLASLYERDTMPKDLLQAHRALDAAVEKLYRPSGFASTTDIIEHLFDRYVALTASIKEQPDAKRSLGCVAPSDRSARTPARVPARPRAHVVTAVWPDRCTAGASAPRGSGDRGAARTAGG